MTRPEPPARCCVALPRGGAYVLLHARVPTGCIQGAVPGQVPVCVDNLAELDIEVAQGRVVALHPPGSGRAAARRRSTQVVDLQGKMVLPTFADLHTHIDKGHTTERSRNPNGSLSGADRSTARDAAFWDEADVERRMDFSLRCAYAHGTSALRTHLINMTPKQTRLTWPVFKRLKQKWAGRVELQGVSLVVLSFFRDQAAAAALADCVAAHGGILGAAVCCAEKGGDPSDDWTTCERDRDELLDRIFTLAKERDLDLDFHTDENGNELARGLRYVAQKAIQHGYQGRVVCGHCCSLAFQPPKELAATLRVVEEAGVTVVSLPLVNQWTQDRSHEGGRTPRWRGITLLHELRAAGIPTAISSDNVRDQFYAYGDLDMLEVFTQSCRMAHLDRPYGDWPQAVTSIPADAMHLPEHGRIGPGLPANFVVFRGRRYSELLSRPQFDRVVVRNGVPLEEVSPSYEELDYVPASIKSGEVPVLDGPASPPPDAAALVGQLTALRMLDLSIWRNISPEVLAAISRLPWLTELYLWSEAPLPDPATLTALEGLTRLELKEERSEHGLCVLSAACFPRLAQLAYSAENMMMLDDRRCIFEEFLFEVTWDKHHLRMQRQEGAAAGQPTACVTMQRAALQAGAHTEEEEEEEAAVTALRHLEALAVTDAELPSLPEGPYLTGLTSLDLSGNSLVGALPPALRAATALRSLDLRGNRPEPLRLDSDSVDMLAGLTALTLLCLDKAEPQASAELARRAPQLRIRATEAEEAEGGGGSPS
ncbi:Cytosine deaminase [Micractinium conductrix]|uniref:Cytosine deaminase n=1 Tax=Micractinium conductrix TaxID=554055 RepID=A0A2P6VFL6_9CHLO|nr:Cytosine deaminase [Micractinium conductrix]|eukprot:PSC72883.1 Cytosine deaminase [Micractinium conductrix]